jgi:hypothetical protein
VLVVYLGEGGSSYVAKSCLDISEERAASAFRVTESGSGRCSMKWKESVNYIGELRKFWPMTATEVKKSLSPSYINDKFLSTNFLSIVLRHIQLI